LTRATRLLLRQRALTVPHVIISPDTVSCDIPGRYISPLSLLSLLSPLSPLLYSLRTRTYLTVPYLHTQVGL
jgi:hypothetical protein